MDFTIDWMGKKTKGRDNSRKEVLISINKAGLSVKGEQRYAIAVRFTPEAVKKVSKTGYLAIGFAEKMKRLYFKPVDKAEGFKLSHSTNKSNNTSISFSTDDVEKWRGMVGEYNLCKDISNDLYYIDLQVEWVTK